MYNYQTEKAAIFTEDGQEMFLKIRDNSKRLLELAGAFNFECVTKGCLGNGWTMLACVDRLVELKEIREITGPNVAGQHRVFVSYNR